MASYYGMEGPTYLLFYSVQYRQVRFLCSVVLQLISQAGISHGRESAWNLDDGIIVRDHQKRLSFNAIAALPRGSPCESGQVQEPLSELTKGDSDPKGKIQSDLLK